jgi:predicted RNase H-like HicB family nuclease
MNMRTSSIEKQTVIAAGRRYVCEFRPQRQGGYLVTCPQFLPLAAYGKTVDTARENAREGIEAWIEYADCREFV